MSERWEQAHQANPTWPETRYMIGWQFAHTCVANCPYCFMRDNMNKLVEDGHCWWSDEQAVAAWAAVAEQHGPCHIVFSGMEPSEQLPLVAAVLKHHYGSMLTNLYFNAGDLRRLVPPERLRLSPSFHPHLCERLAMPFLAKLRALQTDGYRIDQATVVAWPPYLKYLTHWHEDFADAGVRLVTIPFQGEFEGQRYPAAYTEEERALVYGTASPALAETQEPRVACAAGHACAYVLLNGDVWRCSEVEEMGGQNLFRDGGIRFLDEPAACDRPCPCTQFSVYHIREAGHERSPE